MRSRARMPHDYAPRKQMAPELEPLHQLLRAAWHLCPRPDAHPNARRMVGFQHLRSLAAQLYAHGWRVTEPKTGKEMLRQPSADEEDAWQCLW